MKINHTKKILFIALSSLAIGQQITLNAMQKTLEDASTQTIPSLPQDIVVSPLAWLQKFPDCLINPGAIKEVFDDTFKLICLSVVQQNNPIKSKEWLENSTTKAELESYIQQIHEAINKNYSQLRQHLIASTEHLLSLPHERMPHIIEAEHTASNYYWTLEQSLNQAHKELNQKLVILIKFLGTAQEPSAEKFYVPSVDSLISYVEHELYGWRALFKGCTIL